MIRWEEMLELHVVQKLKDVISNWFEVDLFYANEYGKIQGKIFDKNFKFRNKFLKLQMQLNYGHEYLSHDVEKVIENPKSSVTEYMSIFPNVYGLFSSIYIESEYCGNIFIYPIIKNSLTKKEEQELLSKMKEFGNLDENLDDLVSDIKKISDKELLYIKDLLELVNQEVVTYHSEIQKREERIFQLNSELGMKYRYHSMIGKSSKMQHIYRLLEKISKSESTVLINGSNGTGKELVAKAIHYSSPRKDNVFLAQNCSAFNDNLLDSELFGHVKGAFTGAIKDKKGLFEMANGGTLFMDEIADMSLTMQVKLLRVLQEGTFLPVGASVPKKVNVRIIAATNKNLEEMISKGEFREDLFYRINVINVFLPSLKDRKEDIPLLVEHFLEKRCAESGIPTKILSKKCLEKMLDYSWPGNVRELENEVERLVVLAGEDKTITPDILSSKISQYGSSQGSTKGVNTSGTLKEALEELEIIMIRDGLKRCNFNKSRLARELGISRAGLIMKVEKYGLDKRKKVYDAS